MSDIAFVLMDLFQRAMYELAFRCLNHYLELSGDYGGLRVLRMYIAERALIRSKCAMIRIHQGCNSQDDYKLSWELLSLAENLVDMEEHPYPGNYCFSYVTAG